MPRTVSHNPGARFPERPPAPEIPKIPGNGENPTEDRSRAHNPKTPRKRPKNAP
jgi:hypothetical protein